MTSDCGCIPSAPSRACRFIGFGNPISGNLRQIAIDARRIAKALRAARLTAPPRAASFPHGADPDGA